MSRIFYDVQKPVTAKPMRPPTVAAAAAMGRRHWPSHENTKRQAGRYRSTTTGSGWPNFHTRRGRKPLPANGIGDDLRARRMSFAGGPHSGNVAALDWPRQVRLDILSSVIVPAGLVVAALQLGDLGASVAWSCDVEPALAAPRVGSDDRGTL